MLQYYRKIYTKAVSKFMFDCGDAKYTSKSHIYQAAIGATTDNGSLKDVIHKVLASIDGVFGADPDQICAVLGRPGGWPVTEKYLAKKIWELFTPVDPNKQVLALLQASNVSKRSLESLRPDGNAHPMPSLIRNKPAEDLRHGGN
jgi:hypothetical protein